MEENKANNRRSMVDVVVRKHTPEPAKETPAKVLPTSGNQAVAKPIREKKTKKATAAIKKALSRKPKAVNNTDKAPGMKSNILKKAGQLINKHKILIGVSVLLAVVVAVVVTVFNGQKKIPDDYFVTDETKYVMTLDPHPEEKKTPNSRGLVQTYYVYDRDGETITDIKTYFEYVDEAAAKTNYERTKDQEEFKNAELNGKYIIVTMDKAQYQGLKTSDVEQQIENIQRFIKSKNSK